MVRGSSQLKPDQATQARFDDWPHTTRLLPWLIAAFLVMLWLTPFDATTLPIPLPVDPTPDRILLPLLVLVWFVGGLTTNFATSPMRRTPVQVLIALFVGSVLLSLLLNVRPLAVSGEMEDGLRRLALLVSYAMFFVVVATSIRLRELRAFGILIVSLGCLLALGVVWEFRTDSDFFFNWADKLAFGGITVTLPEPESLDPFARPLIAGPTSHGLAVATLMGIALPFAVMGILRNVGRTRVWWALAAAVLLAGSVSTLRKSGFVMPMAALLVMFLYSPRAMIRILPIGLMMVVFIQLLAPGALVKVKAQLLPGRVEESKSTQGRTVDYSAVRPDVVNHLAFGRGFGTYDPKTYRFLDNEYLKRVIETGLVGALMYLLMVLSVMAACHRAIRMRDPTRAAPALAASAGAFAYGVAGLLYDVFYFPQAPYMFFFMAAVGVICSMPRPQVAPAPAGSTARRDLSHAEPVPAG